MASPTYIKDQTETYGVGNIPDTPQPYTAKTDVSKEEKVAALTQEARKLIVQLLDAMDGGMSSAMSRQTTLTFSKTPLKAFSSSDTVTYQAFKSSGGLRSIVLAIRQYCDMSDVVHYGCQALITFSLLDKTAMGDVLLAGGVETVVTCMQMIAASSNSDAKVSALKMLRALTQDEDIRTQIWDAKGVEVIVQVMTSSSDCSRTLSHGALVLSNLAFGNKEIKDAVGDGGGIAAIAHGMSQHSDFQAMQARGSLALRNLCFGSETNQRVGGECGAVEALVNAIQSNAEDREVVHQSCVALTHLSNENMANRKRIVTASGALTLVKLMQRYNGSLTVHDDCISIVRNLATESQVAQEEIGEAGGIKAIVGALEKFKRDEKLCEKGCAALRYMCFLKRNRERVGDEGGMEAIVGVLNTHVTQEAVVQHALLAIGNATFENVGNKVMTGKCKGIESIIRAVEQHRMKADVQEHGCRVLRNLVDGVSEHGRVAAEGGAITVAVFAMMGFADNASVQEQACAMMYNMCSGDGVVDKLQQADVMRLAEKALMNHSKNRGVQLQAGTLIDRINGFEDGDNGAPDKNGKGSFDGGNGVGDDEGGDGNGNSGGNGSGRGRDLPTKKKKLGWPFGRRE